MGGLGALVVIALYISIAYAVVKSAKRRWQKAIVVVGALLIPTADAIYGRIRLQYLCESEAGLKVYRVAERVGGFMASTADEMWIKQYGYRFSEGERTSNKYYRISKQDGQFFVEENVLPKSKYRLRLRHFDEKESYRRSQYLIDEIASGEMLATQTQIGFNGGWAERLIAAFSDAGGGSVARCDNSRLDYVNLVTTTLRP
jgi:hypothetical protein